MHSTRYSGGVPREPNKGGTYDLSPDEKLRIMEVLDHLHVTKQYQEMGSCTVCKKISIVKCSGCWVFYCSNECQTYDWPKHRLHCTKQRDSASEKNSFASSRQMRGSSSVKNFSEENIIITEKGSPFTALTNQLNRNFTNALNGTKSLANFKIANKQYQNRELRPKKNENGGMWNGLNDYKKTNYNERNHNEVKKNMFQKKPANFKKPFSAENREPVGVITIKSQASPPSSKLLKALENIPVRDSNKQTPAKIQKSEVVGTYRESPNRYWVMYVNDLQKYEKIQAALNEECGNYEAIPPKVGLICGCTFFDEWFRGKVTSIVPEIRVHFIDYGNTSVYDQRVFKRLPDVLETVPGLAFLIEFEEGTPEKYKTEDLDSLKLTIEESSKASDGIPRVKILQGEFGTTKMSEKSTDCEIKMTIDSTNAKKGRSVIDFITDNTIGTVLFLPGEGMTRYGTLVPNDNVEAADSIEKILKINFSSSSTLEAKEGDYVLVTDPDGNDQRGKIITKLGSTCYVQLIDCGNVITADTFYALPDDLKNLIELGVKINVEEMISQDKMNSLDTCFFAVTGNASSGKWPCVLKDEEQQLIAKVTIEKPSEVVEWKPEYVLVKSGSSVEISTYCSPNSFYIRPIDAESEQKFMNMNMEIMESAPKAKCFDIPPLPGELCCAKFKDDGCFYRAIVHSVEDGKVKVLFVDFGNTQKTALRNLKPIGNSSKNVPFYAIKVKLKNVSPKQWNNMMEEYIQKLCDESVELTITYDKSIDDGVVLREIGSGVAVNEFIEKAKCKAKSVCSEGSKSAVSSKSEIYLESDLKMTTISAGSQCVLALLHINDIEFETTLTFWATIADAKNFDYVNGELSALISEHCEKISEPYKPSLRELCLAEYEGCWYRAICGECEGDVYNIFFIDFGNICELKATSIRKMKKEFIDAPALAMNCTLDGHEKLKNNPSVRKKICALLQERLNTIISNVKVTKVADDVYELLIPEFQSLMPK